MDGSRENASWRSRITYRRALVVSTAIAWLLRRGIATAAVATQEVSLDSGSVSRYRLGWTYHTSAAAAAGTGALADSSLGSTFRGLTRLLGEGRIEI